MSQVYHPFLLRLIPLNQPQLRALQKNPLIQHFMLNLVQKADPKGAQRHKRGKSKSMNANVWIPLLLLTWKMSLKASLREEKFRGGRWKESLIRRRLNLEWHARFQQIQYSAMWSEVLFHQVAVVAHHLHWFMPNMHLFKFVFKWAKFVNPWIVQRLLSWWIPSSKWQVSNRDWLTFKDPVLLEMMNSNVEE